MKWSKQISRERAELTIVRLDEALDKISKSLEKRASPRRRSPLCSDSEGEEHYGHSHATNGDEPDTSPNMTTAHEALSACATESSVSGGHYTSSLTGTLLVCQPNPTVRLCGPCVRLR